MNFSEFIDVIYIKGYFSSQADFLNELLKNSVQNPEKISLADSTLKGYFSGNSITELADMLYEAVLDTDSLCNHINGLYSAKHKNTKTYDEKYGKKLYKDILFERSTKAFGDIITVEDMARFLSDQFKKIIDETINQSTTKAPIQTSDSSRLSYIIKPEEKKIINRLKILWDELFRIGGEISDNASYTEKMFYSGKIRGLKIQLNTFYSEFKNENSNLLTFRNKFKEIEKLYLLSLEIKSEFFENRFNIPELLNEYDEILKSLIESIEFTEEGNY